MVTVAIASFIESEGENAIPALTSSPNTAQTNLNKNDASSSKADYYDTYDGAFEAIKDKNMTELQKLNGKTIEIAFERHYSLREVDLEKKYGNILMEIIIKNNPDGSATRWVIRFDDIDFKNDKKAAELHNLAKEYKSILVSVSGKYFIDHTTKFENNQHIDIYFIFLTNAQITNIFVMEKKIPKIYLIKIIKSPIRII